MKLNVYHTESVKPAKSANQGQSYRLISLLSQIENLMEKTNAAHPEQAPRTSSVPTLI